MILSNIDMALWNDTVKENEKLKEEIQKLKEEKAELVEQCEKLRKLNEEKRLFNKQILSSYDWITDQLRINQKECKNLIERNEYLEKRVKELEYENSDLYL